MSRWGPVVALGLLACGGPEPRPPYRGQSALEFEGSAPNHLIFLSIDTLRRDRLGLYGAKGGTSPFLDGLASEGFVLNDARQCSSWTLPGTTCVLAGQTNLDRGQAPSLGIGTPVERVEEPLLADWLGDVGFWSGLVGANLWLSPEMGNGSGYQDHVRPGSTAASVWNEGKTLLKQGPEAKDRRFLHLHFMEPHWPYRPDEAHLRGVDALEPWPEDLLDQGVQEAARDGWDTMAPADQDLLKAHMDLLYDGEVRALDAQLAEIWEDLDRGGWLDDTLVVIWSDHGEQIWDHGWKGHAHGLAADEADMAVIFWAENLKPQRFDEPVAGIDLAPTVLDVLGVPKPESITGSVIGTGAEGRPIMANVLGFGGIRQSVSVGDSKLIYDWSGQLTQYERGADPAEQTDVYGAGGTEQTDALWALLRPEIDRLDALVPDVPTMPAGRN